MNLVKPFITAKSGSTAIEYALIAAGIVLAAYPPLKLPLLSPLAFFGTAVVNLTPSCPLGHKQKAPLGTGLSLQVGDSQYGATQS